MAISFLTGKSINPSFNTRRPPLISNESLSRWEKPDSCGKLFLCSSDCQISFSLTSCLRTQASRDKTTPYHFLCTSRVLALIPVKRIVHDFMLHYAVNADIRIIWIPYLAFINTRIEIHEVPGLCIAGVIVLLRCTEQGPQEKTKQKNCRNDYQHLS